MAPDPPPARAAPPPPCRAGGRGGGVSAQGAVLRAQSSGVQEVEVQNLGFRVRGGGEGSKVWGAGCR
jgi:hypothetical protein